MRKINGVLGEAARIHPTSDKQIVLSAPLQGHIGGLFPPAVGRMCSSWLSIRAYLTYFSVQVGTEAHEMGGRLGQRVGGKQVAETSALW